MTNGAPYQELQAARDRLRKVADDLAGTREFGPRIRTANPPRWEIGHVGWFQELWCLRGGDAPSRKASILPNADSLYNSATVAHDTRWDLELPDFAATLRYREEVLHITLQSIAGDASGEAGYFARLSARHEDMHAEAFHYMRQTWAYEAPGLAANPHPAGEPVRGDAPFEGGPFRLGPPADGGFRFDNERSRHPVVLKPFAISRTAVSNAEYLEFVESGGYANRSYWSQPGWDWLQREGRHAPCYWDKVQGTWRQRRFDIQVPLAADEPVVHVSAHEAEAYCRFAGRRLPSEAEWEYAALRDPAGSTVRDNPWGDEPWCARFANLENATLAPVDAYPAGDSPGGCRQMIGNVWEWTSSAFLPYPGFLRDPYKEYSEPWFGTHRVLRGGCFTTSRRIATAYYRNFFTPDRCDVFAGFRTCALWT